MEKIPFICILFPKRDRLLGFWWSSGERFNLRIRRGYVPASWGHRPHPWRRRSSSWRAWCRWRHSWWRSQGRPWGIHGSLLVDESIDMLDSSTMRQPPDGGLGDALDVVSQHLTVTLSTSLSKSLSFGTSSNLEFGLRVTTRSTHYNITHNTDSWYGRLVMPQKKTFFSFSLHAWITRLKFC